MNRRKGRTTVQSHRALFRLTDTPYESFRCHPDDLGLRRQILHHQNNSFT